jgi:predicted DCC family thiol-disulfide oxidoreductase YuxK
VWDGDCGFCLATLEWLWRRWSVWPAAEPWQRLDLAALGLDERRCREAVQLVEADGTTSAGAAAVARLLRAQRSGGWRLLGRLLSAPGARPIAAAAYRAVARHRSRLALLTPLLRAGDRAGRGLDREARTRRVAAPRR